MLRDSSPRRGSRANPARARHHHVERLQRLGRALPVHRWDTRLVRATVREGVPSETGAGRAEDADRSRPRGDGVPELGAAARPVGLERRRRLVELGAAVPAMGGVERVPVDVATSQDLEHPPESWTATGMTLPVGHDEYWSWGMRDAWTRTCRRRERGDLQRQHLLLAGPVRGRPPHHDVLQVPSGRGSGGGTPEERFLTASGRTGASADPKPRPSG